MKLRVLLAVLASLLVLSTPAYAAPAGFLPSSTSWLNPRQGAVLGYAPCGTDMCPQLLATTDGGSSWHSLTPPPVKLPDNHNQVKITVVDQQNAFVTDGNSLWATNTGTRSWYQISLTDLKAPFYISKVAVAHNKVFVLASALGNGESDFTQVYSAPLGSRTLRPVPGFLATGGLTYGDIAVDGDVVQVYLGADFATAQYGYSIDGGRFTSAPLPCPVDLFAILGGIRDGKPIALCNGSGGSPSPGHMTREVWAAPKLGGEFTGSNPAPTVGGTQGFGVATPDSFTVAAVGGDVSFLHSSFDGGKSWSSTELGEEGGFGLFDLQFVNGKVGFVVDGVPDSGDNPVVYRTADSGHTWQPLKF